MNNPNFSPKKIIQSQNRPELQHSIQIYRAEAHDTITVVVVCTIATAKVPLGFAASLVEERNYNCYNVYFNECLQKYNFSLI
jgi:hypothetical protein